MTLSSPEPWRRYLQTKYDEFGKRRGQVEVGEEIAAESEGAGTVDVEGVGVGVGAEKFE